MVGHKVLRQVALTALVSLLIVIASGCAGQSSAPATQAPAAPAAAKPAPQVPAPASAPAAAQQATAAPAAPAPAEVLKVGIMASMTGPTAPTQTQNERFARMAIDDINAKGGIKVGGNAYRIEAVTADDKGNSEGGVEAANRLVLAEKVKVILIGATSPTAGAQGITTPNKVLHLALALSDKSISPQFPLTFQIASANLLTRGEVMFDYLIKQNPQVKRVAMIISDDALGRSAGDAADGIAKARGLTIVSKEYYPLDLKDFNPLVTKLLRENPDAINLGSAGGRGAAFNLLIRALSDQGYRKPLIAYSADTAPVRDNTAILEGFATVGLMDIESPLVTSGEKELMQRYVKQYGPVDINPLMSYNAAGLMKQAMEIAGSVDDTEKIAKALHEGEFETYWAKEFGKLRFGGAKTFGVNAVLEQPIYLSGVAKGKVEVLSRVKATLP